jgi:hypothetical protein
MSEPNRSGAHRRTTTRRPVGFAWKWLALAVALVVTATSSAWNSASADAQWRPLLQQDFSANIPVGGFPGAAFDANWIVYPDGWRDSSGVGMYAPSKVLSTAGGHLRFNLRFDGTNFLGAAVLAKATKGQRFGRYTIRWRADPVSGYGLAFLLWPDSDHWPADGEIDFPEGALDSTIKAFAHHASGDGSQDQFDTGKSMQDWHTSVIEWLPKSVTFYLDGAVVGRSTTGVPQYPMHLVLQTGTAGDGPPPRAAHGVIEVDSVRVDRYVG